MGNRSNKSHMEVEGNRTTRNTSKPAQTFFKNCHFLGGGSKQKSDEKHPWGIVQISHIWK